MRIGLIFVYIWNSKTLSPFQKN